MAAFLSYGQEQIPCFYCKQEAYQIKIHGIPLQQLRQTLFPLSKEYALEYGTAEIEIHKEDIRPGQRIVFVDDLLATGGTAKAAIDLIEELGGVVVKVLFVMELEGLHGRDVLKDYDVESVITYPGK